MSVGYKVGEIALLVSSGELVEVLEPILKTNIFGSYTKLRVGLLKSRDTTTHTYKESYEAKFKELAPITDDLAQMFLKMAYYERKFTFLKS